MQYLLDRLREPGTMRSLIWVLLSLAGMTEVEELSAQLALAASALLGVGSALRPEPKPPVVPAQDIVETVQAAVRAHAAVRDVAGVGRQ